MSSERFKLASETLYIKLGTQYNSITLIEIGMSFTTRMKQDTQEAPLFKVESTEMKMEDLKSGLKKKLIILWVLALGVTTVGALGIVGWTMKDFFSYKNKEEVLESELAEKKQALIRLDEDIKKRIEEDNAAHRTRVAELEKSFAQQATNYVTLISAKKDELAEVQKLIAVAKEEERTVPDINRLFFSASNRLVMTEGAYRELSERLTNTIVNVSRAEGTLQATETAIEKATAVLKAETQRFESRKAETEREEQNRDSVREAVHKAKKELESVKDQIAGLKRDVTRLSGVTGALVRADADLRTVRASYETVSSDLQQARERLGEVTSEQGKVTKEIEGLKEVRKKLDLEFTEVSKRIQQARIVESNAVASIAKVTGEISAEQKALARLQGDVASATNRLQIISSQVELKRKEVTSAEGEKSKLEGVIASLKGQRKTLEDEVERLRTLQKKEADQFGEDQKTLASTRLAIASERGVLKSVQDDYDQIAKQRDELKQGILKLKSELADLQALQMTSAAEKDDLQKSVSRLKSELASLREEKKRLAKPSATNKQEVDTAPEQNN